MGVLADGQWLVSGFESRVGKDGNFVRPPSQFRDFVQANYKARFHAEPGRYQLFVSPACPWAHRTLIVRTLKGLETVIGVTLVDPVMGEEGWRLKYADSNREYLYLRELYVEADPHATGPVTVPVLWDKRERTIVNNESSEIIRMLNTEFSRYSQLTEAGLEANDFYPESLRDEIDRINDDVYLNINNGVYRCGFARSQEAYETAFHRLFTALDRFNSMLEDRPFLAGDVFTEADIRLFTTLIRFDLIYYSHFKCNWKQIKDYDNLWPYLRMIFQIPGVRETCDFGQMKTHYYRSQPSANPSGIVPVGPDLHFSDPHNRATPLPLEECPTGTSHRWRKKGSSQLAPHETYGA